MTVRHVPEHRDEGTQQRRFSSGSAWHCIGAVLAASNPRTITDV